MSKWNDDRERYNAYRRAWRRERRFSPGAVRCKHGGGEIRGPFRASREEYAKTGNGLIWCLWCPRCGRYGRILADHEIPTAPAERVHGGKHDLPRGRPSARDRRRV